MAAIVVLLIKIARPLSALRLVFITDQVNITMKATAAFVIVDYMICIPLQLMAQSDEHPVSDRVYLTFFTFPHSAEIRYTHLPQNGVFVQDDLGLPSVILFQGRSSVANEEGSTLIFAITLGYDDVECFVTAVEKMGIGCKGQPKNLHTEPGRGIRSHH